MSLGWLLALAVLQEPPSRYVHTFLVSEENDLFQGRRSDEQYTQGLRLQIVSHRPGDPEPYDLLQIPRQLYPAADLKALRFGSGVAVGQNIYTPEEISSFTPDPEDRPWAAWLYAAFSTVVEDRARGRQDVYEVTAGIIGPLALGRPIQRWVHRVVDSPFPTWTDQLPNEAALMVSFDRRWYPEALWSVGPPGNAFDVFLVPRIGFRAGSPFTEFGAGLRLVAGWEPPRYSLAGAPLPSAAPPSMILKPADEASDFAVWAYAGADARGVAWNTFLDGTIFRDSASVDREEAVLDLAVGAALQLFGLTLSYGLVIRSPELEASEGFHRFGSLQLSFQFPMREAVR